MSGGTAGVELVELQIGGRQQLGDVHDLASVHREVLSDMEDGFEPCHFRRLDLLIFEQARILERTQYLVRFIERLSEMLKQ